MAKELICPITKDVCHRDCLHGQCAIRDEKRTSPPTELETQANYFIPSHRLGAIESAAQAMLANGNKRSRRVELNHIQHVLKTLKLIPHSVKVVALGIGCLDAGQSGLFVLCTSPTHIEGDIP